jgi:hypothetical protein
MFGIFSIVDDTEVVPPAVYLDRPAFARALVVSGAAHDDVAAPDTANSGDADHQVSGPCFLMNCSIRCSNSSQSFTLKQ